MGMSTNISSYIDCEEHFERAVASANGIAITCPSKGDRTRLIQRLNQLRVLIRERNKQVYAADPEKYGKSPYDHLEIAKDPENECRLFIRERSIGGSVKVEEL